MIGYATVSGDGYTTTTGGAGGVVTTVTTLAQLQTWATARENNTAPAILYISGKIASTSNVVVTIKHGANISIYGIGSTSELQNIGLNIRDYKNVIVRNMKLHEVFYPNDALTIDECQHVWVDHNELYSKIGTGITVDTYDGLLDIKNGSRYVTVSWNYFHHHMKCMLYGHTDNTSQQATDSQMRITMHHNWVSYTNSRNPSIRFGALHMFNNYFEEIDDYGLAARDGAHVRSENNHYNNVLLSMSTDKFPVSGLPNGYICQSGNSLTGSTGAAIISQTGCDFWTSSILPYSYTLDATANVAALVKANTGVGKVTNLKSGTIENIDQPKSQLSVYVYPNPVLTTATIELSLDIESDVNVAIYNMVGQLVNVLAKGIYPEGENEIAFSKDGLKPGMFILSVKAGSMEKQLKIIIK
jgi:pectate lyase